MPGGSPRIANTGAWVCEPALLHRAGARRTRTGPAGRSSSRTTATRARCRLLDGHPGVWLSGRVWATHGHYLDRHLLPESAYGLARGLLGRKPRDGATPVDYEEAGGPSVTRVEGLLTRWLPRPLAVLADDLAELLRASTMPALPRVPAAAWRR